LLCLFLVTSIILKILKFKYNAENTEKKADRTDKTNL